MNGLWEGFGGDSRGFWSILGYSSSYRDVRDGSLFLWLPFLGFVLCFVGPQRDQKAGSKSVTPGVCYGEENLKTSYIFSVRRGSGRGGDSIFEVLGKSGLDFGAFWLNCV